MNIENMVKLQHFFSADIKIKKEIHNIALPNLIQYIDDDVVSKYTNKLNDSLIYVFSELKCIAVDIFGCESIVFKKVCNMENIIKNDFYNCGFDINKLNLFYQKYISNMEMDFINNVKSECVGYTDININFVENAVSINEILHFMHSYIINNDEILQAIPIIKEKINNYQYPISLRGVGGTPFEQLFESFPVDIDCSWTDMVVINEKKLIMMVRDRGHALSIEISLFDGIARIEYFIPKICNIDIVNKLPGVNKINEKSVGVTGIIEVPKNQLSTVLYDFISKVPMDDSIVFESSKIF